MRSYLELYLLTCLLRFLKHCVVLGYEERDCWKVMQMKSVNNETRFTEQGKSIPVHFNITTLLLTRQTAWESHLPTIRPMLEETKAFRLSRELDKRRRTRSGMVNKVYRELVKAILPDPLTFACLPNSSEFSTLPKMRNLIDDDTEAHDERRALIQTEGEKMRPLLSSLEAQRRAAIIARMPSKAIPPGFDPALLQDLPPWQSTLPPAYAAFELATSVFRCGGQLPHDRSIFRSRKGLEKAIFGLKVFAHKCQHCKRFEADELVTSSLPVFDDYGRRIVLAILERLSLDSSRTTAADLDRLDARFLCLNCPVQHEHEGYHRRRGKRGRAALTWRELVSSCVF